MLKDIKTNIKAYSNKVDSFFDFSLKTNQFNKVLSYKSSVLSISKVKKTCQNIRNKQFNFLKNLGKLGELMLILDIMLSYRNTFFK